MHASIVRPLPKHATRRHCMFAGELEEGFACFAHKSVTREGVTYRPVVDEVTGEVECQCEHFRYRCAEARLGHAPTVADAPRLCRHLQAAIASAQRKGLLPTEPRGDRAPSRPDPFSLPLKRERVEEI